MRLHCHLRHLRLQQNLTLRSIAETAGISAGQLSQIEQGRTLPRDRDLARLEEAYGHPVEAWYSGRTLVAITEDEETR